VLNELCSKLLLMYRGEVVEAGPTAVVLSAPHHPVQQGWLHPCDDWADEDRELSEIAGVMGQVDPSACLFRPRCPFAAAGTMTTAWERRRE